MSAQRRHPALGFGSSMINGRALVHFELRVTLDFLCVFSLVCHPHIAISTDMTLTNLKRLHLLYVASDKIVGGHGKRDHMFYMCIYMN